MALLEVKDLRVFYGNIEALKGISLQVDAGQIVAILGGNGAGKTTTLRTISGLQRPRSGTVTFNGKNLVGQSAHGIVGLGVSHVPEGRRIFNVLTVDENLNLGGYLIRSKGRLVKERKAAVFALFPRLAERRLQLAGTMSGGEQAMVSSLPLTNLRFGSVESRAKLLSITCSITSVPLTGFRVAF